MTGTNSGRIPELDGLRGLAAIVVVIAHYFAEVEHGIPLWFGWMGVNLFFVLSGFLIGSIILEHGQKANFFSVFYIRRSLRIMPVYFLVLGAVFIGYWLVGPTQWLGAPLPFGSYATFTQNVVMAIKSDYGARILLPTWTLAVEEQFYLLIPFMLIVIPSYAILATLITMAMAALGLRAIAIWQDQEIAANVLLFTRADILLLGVVVAWVHRRGPVLERKLSAIRVVAVILAVLLAVQSKFGGNELSRTLTPVLVAAIFAAYILSAVQGSGPTRFLQGRPWIFLGSISYCLYLVHQPVSVFLHGLLFNGRPDVATLSQITTTVAALVASIAISVASRNTVELPLIRLGKTFRYYPKERT